ncbi:UNVERIFIED_CONTAM: hypothetical protein Sindi_0324900 [Sesamum indicum]
MIGYVKCIKMSSAEEKPKWTVFEEVKDISVAPEALMADINSAIAALEYARAATFLQRPPPSKDLLLIIEILAFCLCLEDKRLDIQSFAQKEERLVTMLCCWNPRPDK